MAVSVRNGKESGFAIAQSLVAIVILGVTILALAQAIVHSLQTRDKSINDSLALQIALEKMEYFAGVDPSTLSDGDSWSENVTRSGRTFSRNSTVTVNSDASRTITIAVSPTLSSNGGNITITDTFSDWSAQ